MRQSLNKMREFLKVIALNYSLSRQLTDSMAKTFPAEAGQLTQSLYFHWFWMVIMCYLVKFQWLVAFTIHHFHWLFNCPSWPVRLRAPANLTAFNSKISNGNRTEWCPIRSEIIRVFYEIRGSPICLIKSMITDRIRRHEVFASSDKKPLKRARDGAYCPMGTLRNHDVDGNGNVKKQ